MKGYRTITGILLVIAIIYGSCTKEFSPELDLVDEPVVYAILNHRDSRHYVRISRSFIQPITGQTIVPPVYDPDSLDVFLEVYRFGQRVGYTVVMTPELVEKDTGLFESKNQLIYYADIGLVGDSECRLSIFNRQNGKSISSTCNLFSLQGFKPMVMANLTRLDFKSIPEVFFYEVNCLFHFVEVSETDTIFKTISYPVGTIINGSKDAGLEMSISLERPDWWGYLGRHIPVKLGVVRYAFERPLEFRLLVGDQYLFDYRRSFSGNETVIHTGQSFSNIQGGFGIFSAYDETSLFYQAMLPDWYDKLAENPETKGLNFANHPWQ